MKFKILLWIKQQHQQPIVVAVCVDVGKDADMVAGVAVDVGGA